MIKAKESRKEFEELLSEMLRIHDIKSADYANEDDRFSNFRSCEMMGLPAWKGIVVRIGDKFSRICEFAKKEKLAVSDESFEDTCLDLANYALLLLQAHRDYRNRDQPSKIEKTFALARVMSASREVVIPELNGRDDFGDTYEPEVD